MAEIGLGNGVFATVDDKDLDLVSGYSWYLHVTPTGKRYARADLMRDRVKTRVYMHRLIAGTPKGKITDHRDSDGLNNRRGNLRECNYAQNMRNSRPKKHSSRFKGVSWRKREKKWQVTIEIGGRKSIWLGFFTEEIEAAKAYDLAAKERFGEFAKLNFSEEPEGSGAPSRTASPGL